MKRFSRIFTVLVLCFLFLPVVSAETKEGFVTSFSENVKVSDDVNASSVIAGESVKSLAKVRGVNFMAGNRVNHSGESDYLAIAGNSIDVSGIVFNDSFIAGNVISFEKDADLQRDVVVFGADVEVKGSFGRNLTIYAEKVSFDGANVRGDVKVYSDSISVDDTTNILGSLSYLSDASAKISSNTTNVNKMNPLKVEKDETILDIVISKVISISSLIVIFALLTLIAPKIFDQIQNDFESFSFSKALETGARGVACLIIAPLVSIALLIIPFTIPLSLISLVLYIIAIYISKIFTAYFIGYKLWQKLLNKDINVLVVGLLGFSVLFVLDFIPVISSIVGLCSLVLGFGIMYDYLANKK